jgi:hypothetical protein
MGKVLYEGDDFKRMLRTDMIALQRLVDQKKFGIFEVAYKDTKIKVEIKKKGDDIVVKRWRPVRSLHGSSGTGTDTFPFLITRRFVSDIPRPIRPVPFPISAQGYAGKPPAGPLPGLKYVPRPFSAAVTLLYITSPIPVGEGRIVPAGFRTFGELLPREFRE